MVRNLWVWKHLPENRVGNYENFTPLNAVFDNVVYRVIFMGKDFKES